MLVLLGDTSLTLQQSKCTRLEFWFWIDPITHPASLLHDNCRTPPVLVHEDDDSMLLAGETRRATVYKISEELLGSRPHKLHIDCHIPSPEHDGRSRACLV